MKLKISTYLQNSKLPAKIISIFFYFCIVTCSQSIAILDSYLDPCYIQQFENQIQIFGINSPLSCKSLHQQNLRTHSSVVLSNIFQQNPQAEVIYFSVSEQGQKLMREEMISNALIIIQKSLKSNEISIRYVLMCFGSKDQSSLISSLIEDISNSFPQIIFISAAGNDGPHPFTVLFPANLSSVIAIGTSSILRYYLYQSSKGPGSKDSQFPLIKPDFILEDCPSTSIAAARVAGFLTKFDFQSKGELMQSLIESSFVKEDLSILEQGFGVIPLGGINNLHYKSSQFQYISIFPREINLRIQENEDVYWEPLYQQLIENKGVFYWQILVLNLKLKYLKLEQIRVEGEGCQFECLFSNFEMNELDSVKRIDFVIKGLDKLFSERGRRSNCNLKFEFVLLTDYFQLRQSIQNEIVNLFIFSLQ